jgi:hypothetical protein
MLSIITTPGKIPRRTTGRFELYGFEHSRADTLLLEMNIMAYHHRFTLVLAAVLCGILAFGTYLLAYNKRPSRAGKDGSALPAAMSVTVSSDYAGDSGYHHCFRQRRETSLTFETYTDSSAETVNFVLWSIEDLSNPVIAEPSTDWPVKNGYVKIVVAGDQAGHPRIAPPHLGPGPYMATLTASTSAGASADASAKKKKTVGNAAYYYQTWVNSPNDCDYH